MTKHGTRRARFRGEMPELCFHRRGAAKRRTEHGDLEQNRRESVHCGPFFDGSHILVIVNDVTKWIEAIRTFGTGAVLAMTALGLWQEKHGRTELLYTDNASAWNSDMFRRWAASRNIDT